MIQKLAEVGNILEQNQTAVVVADEANAWIAANIEETAVGPVTVGQTVKVVVDEGGEFTGKVIEVRKSVASQFALIPSDNGAGNFTKVVQRVPIKVGSRQSDGTSPSCRSICRSENSGSLIFSDLIRGCYELSGYRYVFFRLHREIQIHGPRDRDDRDPDVRARFKYRERFDSVDHGGFRFKS